MKRTACIFACAGVLAAITGTAPGSPAGPAGTSAAQRSFLVEAVAVALPGQYGALEITKYPAIFAPASGEEVSTTLGDETVLLPVFEMDEETETAEIAGRTREPMRLFAAALVQEAPGGPVSVRLRIREWRWTGLVDMWEQTDRPDIDRAVYEAAFRTSVGRWRSAGSQEGRLLFVRVLAEPSPPDQAFPLGFPWDEVQGALGQAPTFRPGGGQDGGGNGP